LEQKTQSNFAQRLPALASRDFILFLIGQLISVIGTWMQATALPYLAYRISGRPLDLGIIGFSTTLPTLLFALPAGVFVEHWDKRVAVIILQGIMSVQAFGLAFLTFTGRIQIWHITLLAFLFGSATAVEVTARQAMLIELTGRDALPNAIALQTTAFNLGRVLGPLCAAWLIEATGNEGSVFFANGISFIFVMMGLFFARTRFKVEEALNPAQSLRGEFKEGLVYIRHEAVVMSVILVAALVGFFGVPLIQQIPAFARDVFRTTADTEAVIATRTSHLYAAQGVGALIAAFIAAYISPADKNKMLLFGQITFILPIIGLGLVANAPLALILLTFIGWGTVTQLVTMNTIIQTRVPNGLRGRVFSMYFWALQGVAPFGSIFIGWIAQNWGVQTAAIVGGTFCLVGVSAVRLVFANGRYSSV
jgi:MFS family permease